MANMQQVWEIAVTAIVSFVDTIEKGENAVRIFMDLLKAFDSIDHSQFLKKLHEYGIQSSDLQWLEFYLLERRHSMFTFNYYNCWIKNQNLWRVELLRLREETITEN